MAGITINNTITVFDDKEKEQFISNISKSYYNSSLVAYFINRAIDLHYNEEETLKFIC